VPQNARFKQFQVFSFANLVLPISSFIVIKFYSINLVLFNLVLFSRLFLFGFDFFLNIYKLDNNKNNF
jgi:hypothetical protein